MPEDKDGLNPPDPSLKRAAELAERLEKDGRISSEEYLEVDGLRHAPSVPAGLRDRLGTEMTRAENEQRVDWANLPAPGVTPMGKRELAAAIKALKPGQYVWFEGPHGLQKGEVAKVTRDTVAIDLEDQKDLTVYKKSILRVE